MTSLSKVTSATRKILEYAGILIGGIIVVMILISVGSAIKQAIAPTPPPPPTVSFGKLPQILFPQGAPVNPSSVTYTVNTLTGELPTLPDRATVYEFQTPQPQLLALDNAKKIANAAGFSDTPTQLTDTSYKWTTTQPLPMDLTMNTQTFDFTLTSSYLTDQSLITASSTLTQDGAVKKAQDFFSAVEPLPDTIDKQQTKTTLFSIQNGTLVPASSLSNTQAIRVDFSPKTIDTLPIFTPNPAQSLIYAIVTNSASGDTQVVAAQLIHKDLSNQKGTYPIKSAKEAFDELKNGKAFIASIGNTTNVSITNVVLGYYVDPTPQQYLMPIIVFEGDNGFFAYVNAIQNSWMK